MVSDEVLDLCEIYGERRKYAKEHGLYSLMGCFHTIHWKDKEAENVYRECNKRGITWQEYKHIDTSKNVVY